MANRAATLKVWGDAVFDLPGFARANYPPSCDSDNAGGSICSQGCSSCSSAAGLMGAWGHGTLELGDCSATCLASAGVSCGVAVPLLSRRLGGCKIPAPGPTKVM